MPQIVMRQMKKKQTGTIASVNAGGELGRRGTVTVPEDGALVELAAERNGVFTVLIGK